MANCTRRHLSRPIPQEDWKCPKCGKVDTFACWDADFDCSLDHADDYAFCTECEYGSSLGRLTKAYWKNKGKTFIKCPHCNGTGQMEEAAK